MEQIIKENMAIPYIDCMTASMVADYYGVSKATIKNRYAAHREEFDKFGVMTINSKEFEELLPKNAEYTRAANRCMVDYKFETGMTVSLSTNKNLVFTREAAEYMEEVLEPQRKGSPEHISKSPSSEANKEKVNFRDADEKKLCLYLAKAFSSGDTFKVLNAALKLDTYRIAKIAELSKENEQLKSEVSNRIAWTERASASRVVKVLTEILECKQNDLWNSIYYKLTVSYHLPLEERRKLPLIDAVENSEWHYVYRAIVDICREKYLDIYRIFNKAEVNITGLEIMFREV